jgi:hypothetical protein
MEIMEGFDGTAMDDVSDAANSMPGLARRKHLCMYDDNLGQITILNKG